MSKNDEIIAALRQQVDERRARLGPKPSFRPITNSVLNLPLRPNAPINLHALNATDTLWLLVELNNMQKGAAELGLGENPVISGFPISDWLHDVRQRIEVTRWVVDKATLDGLEQRLKDLLSEEAKTANALDEIKKLLG